ncbi:MAG: PhnD/SsuA/transferrin family substrate-binding protein [Clostridiales bacterium]|nr:PhnD/SsuA/transferrin family substrate-binding protein [Clostridiales bacterium]
MKKYLAILVAIILIASVCAMCACNDNKLTLYVPDGAPALSVAKIVNDKAVGKQAVDTVVTTGEEVVAKCSNGEADMAVLPTNAAVNICKKRNDYLLFSVNVYGVLYIVGTQRIESLAELQGETLYSIGLGNTPEYVFKKVCDTWGVKYQGENAIDIQYQTDATTIIPQILNGKAKFALLGEPAVTQLMAKAQDKGIEVFNLFDLQQLWQEATDSSQNGYPQASLIVKKDLLTDEFATQLMASLTANSAFVTANCSSLSQLLGKAGSSLTVTYTTELIARCNLTIIAAQDAKADIASYLSTFGITSIPDSIYHENSN